MILVGIAIAFVVAQVLLGSIVGYWLRKLDEADRRDDDAPPHDFDSWLLP